MTFNEVINNNLEEIVNSVKLALKNTFHSDIKGLAGSEAESLLPSVLNKCLLSTDFRVVTFNEINDHLKDEYSFYKETFNFSFDNFKKAVSTSTGTPVSKADCFLVNQKTKDIVDAIYYKCSLPVNTKNARIMLNNDANGEINNFLHSKIINSLQSDETIIIPNCLFLILDNQEINLYYYNGNNFLDIYKKFEDFTLNKLRLSILKNGEIALVGKSQILHSFPKKGNGKSSFARGVSAQRDYFHKCLSPLLKFKSPVNIKELKKEAFLSRMNGEFQ